MGSEVGVLGADVEGWWEWRGQNLVWNAGGGRGFVFKCVNERS